MAEMAPTAGASDRDRARPLIADSTVEDFVKGATEAGTRVVSPDVERLTAAVAAAGGVVSKQEDGSIVVSGLDSPTIGKLALKESVELHELSPVPRFP